MPEITSIEPQVKDKTRCNVFVDGRFYCGIKLEVAIKYHLKAGAHIEKAELDEIQLETEKSQALDKALNHISATMKTEKQIRDFLAGKGYVDAVINYVTERMKYYGYIDDAQYCRAYISGVKGKGKRAMEARLLRCGVDKDVVESALEEVVEDADEIAALIEKYMRGKEPTRENIYKACRNLLGKGYSYDAVKDACDKLYESGDN